MTRSNAFKLLIAIGLVCAVAVAYRAGVFEALGSERLEAAFRSLGLWGPVLYVFLFACLEAFFVPGIVFVVPGGLVWDWPTLFVLSLLGATGAAMVGFTFARTIGRGFVESRLSERARAYDAAIARNGLRTVILLRLIFFIAPWVSWLFGLSRVRFRDFVFGTVVGFIPMMLAFTWLGANGFDWISTSPILGTVALVIPIVLMLYFGRSLHRRMQAEMEASALNS